MSKKDKWIDKRKQKTSANFKERKELNGKERRAEQTAIDIKQFGKAIKHINKSLKHLKKGSNYLMDVHTLKTKECKTIFEIRDELFSGLDKLQDDFEKRTGENWR